MKEYRLAAWPEIRGVPYDRVAYRRLLGEMSQRHLTLSQLVEVSGLRRLEVQNFIDMLDARGLIKQRERPRLAWHAVLARPIAWVGRCWASATRGD